MKYNLKLRRNKEMEMINEIWTDNNIGADGARMISEALKINSTLTELNLRCDNLIEIKFSIICKYNIDKYRQQYQLGSQKRTWYLILILISFFKSSHNIFLKSKRNYCVVRRTSEHLLVKRNYSKWYGQ